MMEIITGEAENVLGTLRNANFPFKRDIFNKMSTQERNRK